MRLQLWVVEGDLHQINKKKNKVKIVKNSLKTMLCKSINNNIKIWNKSCREENHSLSSYRTGFVEEVYRILSFQKVSQGEAVVKG